MEQVDVLKRAIETLERLGIVYMVVGSFASGSYGEPRLTLDIDVVIELDPSQVDALCDAFPPPEFYVSKDAARQAIRNRSMFNVLHADTGSKVDFIIPKEDTYGREQVARRQRVQLVPGQEGYAARPEDVIIGKLVFYREGGSEKHMRDIGGMLRTSGGEIDQAYIERWAQKLGVAEEWRTALRRAKGN